MHPQAVELVKCIRQQVVLLGDQEILELIGRDWEILFYDAKIGTVEFLTVLINEYPSLILKIDERGWSIFHYAVVYRQDVFKLIYEIGSFKDFIASLTDHEGNNMLHLAGKLAPSDRLSVVSGDALQMQRELLWFKEVSKVVQPLYVEARDRYYGRMPREAFEMEHIQLMGEGEKWIKETANSCMLVATLITSVVFTATFQVPVNNKRNTGVPILIQKLSFAISLISSATSIITFLSLYTSGDEEEDFLFWLPAKLAFGILTLSTSIAAMMVIFCSTFFIVFDDGMLPFIVIVSIVASVPLILFLKQQLSLLLDVIRSTYMSNSLFQPRKRTLFPKERATKSNRGKKAD